MTKNRSSQKLITGRTFDQMLRHESQLIEGYELEKCLFDGGSGIIPIGGTLDLRKRPTVRNITLRNCTTNASVNGAILEEITIDGMKRFSHPIFLRGNAYKHVRFKGKICAASIRGDIDPGSYYSSEDQKRITAEWDAANAEYYKGVDWAIDIREAVFTDFSISGVPSRLILRDPAKTAVVTREKALEGKWRKIALGGFFYSISWLIESNYDDVLLIACSGSKKFQEQLDDLQVLRDKGIAE